MSSSGTSWRDSIDCVKQAAESLRREAEADPKDSELKQEARTLSEELLDIFHNLEQLKIDSPSPQEDAEDE